MYENVLVSDTFCLNSTDSDDCDLYFAANLTGF